MQYRITVAANDPDAVTESTLRCASFYTYDKSGQIATVEQAFESQGSSQYAGRYVFSECC